MPLNVRPITTVEYLSDSYQDFTREEIPIQFRDKSIPSNYDGSPFDLLSEWGVISSLDGYTVSYRNISINGCSMCEEAVFCLMEPCPFSPFRRVSAIGKTCFFLFKII